MILIQPKVNLPNEKKSSTETSLNPGKTSLRGNLSFKHSIKNAREIFDDIQNDGFDGYINIDMENEKSLDVLFNKINLANNSISSSNCKSKILIRNKTKLGFQLNMRKIQSETCILYFERNKITSKIQLILYSKRAVYKKCNFKQEIENTPISNDDLKQFLLNINKLYLISPISQHSIIFPYEINQDIDIINHNMNSLKIPPLFFHGNFAYYDYGSGFMNVKAIDFKTSEKIKKYNTFSVVHLLGFYWYYKIVNNLQIEVKESYYFRKNIYFTNSKKEVCFETQVFQNP